MWNINFKPGVCYIFFVIITVHWGLYVSCYNCSKVPFLPMQRSPASNYGFPDSGGPGPQVLPFLFQTWFYFVHEISHDKNENEYC